jgi:hypothetical protein
MVESIRDPKGVDAQAAGYALPLILAPEGGTTTTSISHAVRSVSSSMRL